MQVNGIRAIAVYDPSTGTTVQISKPIGNSFEFSQSRYDTGDRHPTGGMPDQADVSECRFQFIDSGGTLASQLYAWMTARTRVSLVAIGNTTNVQWYETDHINITRMPLTGMAQGRGDRYMFEMVREGHGKHAIYQQTNLLGHIAGRNAGAWVYTGSNDIADGYTSTGAGTASWFSATSTQIITHSAAGHGIYADVVLPIQMAGVTLSLSCEMTTLHGETGEVQMQISGRNYAGTEILNTTTDFDSTGRKTVSITASASDALYSVRVFPLLTPTGITLSDDVRGRYPTLRVDSYTTWTAN